MNSELMTQIRRASGIWWRCCYCYIRNTAETALGVSSRSAGKTFSGVPPHPMSLFHSSHSDDSGPHGDPDEVPMGTPVATPAPDDKLARMGYRSKVLSIVSGLTLTVVASSAFWGGVQKSSNTLLARTVMGWMTVFGVLIVLAELGVQVIRTHVHVLAYRTGRAFVAIFASTICLTAAPSEITLAGYHTGTHGGVSFVAGVQYQFLGVGILLLISAIYALRLSARSRLNKMAQEKAHSHAATASSSSHAKVMV